MKPYVWPSSDDALPVSARRTFPRQFRANHGTLNLFASSRASESPHSAATRSASNPVTGQRGLRHHNHNRESTTTREFPANGVRRVAPPSRSETPHGIRHVVGAAAGVQHVQVVNITAAYKDPAQMAPLHTGVRCTPRRGHSSEVEAALAYSGTRQQLSARAANVPVGKPAPPSPFTVDYSLRDKFAQSVRDHAQQRTRGVAEFYVQLVRNAVGCTTSSTPKPVLVPWSLDSEPTRRVLTLLRCRDQLVALTAIPISLEDLATLIWGAGGAASGSAAPSAAPAPLEEKVVPFRDFAAAFGQNSSDRRLAQMKI
jgi:hypothetical protein